MSITKRITIFTLMILISCPFIIYGSWYETQNVGLGELSFNGSAGMVSGSLEKIPNSTYVLLNSSNRLALFDVGQGLFRDAKIGEASYRKMGFMRVPAGGWDIYFAVDNKFGKLHISSEGVFGEETWLDEIYTLTPETLTVASRKEVWFFAEKIYKYETDKDIFKEYNYASGWDINFNTISLYPSESLESVIVRSKGKTIQDYQAMQLDLLTGKSNLISASAGFFEDINDIANWNGRAGSYLILRDSKEIWSYNYANGNLLLLVSGFNGHSQNGIMQNETGNMLYILGRDNDLLKVNLETKTFDSYPLPLKNDDVLYYRSGGNKILFDSDRLKIIDFATESVWPDPKLIVINVLDVTVQYVEGVPDGMSNTIKFYSLENKLVGLVAPHIYTIDLGKMKVAKSFPYANGHDRWGTIPGGDSPSIIPETYNLYFTCMKTLGGKDYICTGPGMQLWDSNPFPGTNKALFKIWQEDYSETYWIYDSSSKKINEVTLPHSAAEFYPNPENGEIIATKGIYSKDQKEDLNGSVMFIKSDGTVNVWTPPDIESLTDSFSIFDNDNNSFWAMYEYGAMLQWRFYKLSTTSHKLLHSFNISGELFNKIDKIYIDPSEKYIYALNKITTGSYTYNREFIMLDATTGSELIRFMVQENASDGFESKASPGIIPIPGQERVFLWDYYGAWSIDTEARQILYGEKQNDPQASNLFNDKITGFWDENRQKVVVVDLCHDVFNEEKPDKRILEVDLETGEVTKEFDLPDENIRSVFYPKDRSRIYLLSYSYPRYFVYNFYPKWEDPVTIENRTNFIQYAPGDTCTYSIRVKNSDRPQTVTLYLWLCIPDGQYLFFNGTGWDTALNGFNLTLPPDMDVSVGILNQEIIEGIPEGMYNFNAIFLSEDFEFGPMGTWNYYVGKESK